VTGCHAGTVRLWDLASGILLNDIRGNAGEIVALVFSPDGKTLLTASHDATARFWDVESGRQLGPTFHHTDAVHCAAFHPDGKSVATGSRDGIIRRWEVPLPPRRGEVDQVRRWVEARTGLKLDRGAGLATYAVTCQPLEPGIPPRDGNWFAEPAR
jgi:WD40 repeat protein